MKTVLIVDDEAEIVDLLSMVLEDDWLTLLTAYDGEQALAIVRAQHPDLVLTDIMMPRLNGRELCEAIRADPSVSDTVIIVMSAVKRIELYECGANELIRKPFDVLAVSETVQRYLNDVA